MKREEEKDTRREETNLLITAQNAKIPYIPHVYQIPCVYGFTASLVPHLRDVKNISFQHGFQITRNLETGYEELWYKAYNSDPGTLPSSLVLLLIPCRRLHR